jgi:hypothetical protein
MNLQVVRIGKLRIEVVSLGEHRVPNERVLYVSLLVVLVVNVGKTESGVIPVSPFKIVN